MESKVWSAKCGVESGECRVWSVECRAWSHCPVSRQRAFQHFAACPVASTRLCLLSLRLSGKGVQGKTGCCVWRSDVGFTSFFSFLLQAQDSSDRRAATLWAESAQQTGTVRRRHRRILPLTRCSKPCFTNKKKQRPAFRRRPRAKPAQR